MKLNRILFIIFVTTLSNLYSQHYYVDPIKGNDQNNGSLEKPFKSIESAVAVTNEITGSGNIEIILLPGIYTLKEKIILNPVRVMNDTTEYVISALHNPDDNDWLPNKMPIIQSVSKNNSQTQFEHSTGFLVASKNVRFKGLKFLGNSNPGVKYYYPISKENPSLENLVVEQCMFIGAKESAPIQGAIWAHGPTSKIKHNVFFQCRNAILLFQNVEGFEISNNIISESYESAFWFGPNDPTFTFQNNIIFDNNAFIVGNKNLKYTSTFDNNTIENNSILIGYWFRENQGIIEIKKPEVTFKNKIKMSNLSLNTNQNVTLEKNHLHVNAEQNTSISDAGIFIKKRN